MRKRTTRQKLETVLEVPEESLGSPENSPRVYINHKSPKHWYSDNGDHCKQVNSLRHMHESQVGPYGSARDTVIAVPGYFLDSPENHHRTHLQHANDRFGYTHPACQQVLKGNLNGSHAPCEAAKEQVLDNGRRELETLLKVPVYFLDSPENNPRPHVQYMNDEYDDTVAACRRVSNLGHMRHSQVHCEAAGEWVLDCHRQDLETILDIPGDSLDSQEKRLWQHMQYRDEEFWHGDIQVLNPGESQKSREAAIELVLDQSQLDLLTVLEGPEYSLDSQENSPRLQDQHTEDEFWYSDIEAPCQGVLDPGHKHSQDVQADRNQLVKQGLKDQLNFKSIDFSPHTTLLSHLSVLAKNSHVLRMGVHTMVKVISSMALTVGFMLLTFLASVENCVGGMAQIFEMWSAIK